jgi:hypothetical protein
MNNYQKAKQTSHKLILLEAKNNPNAIALVPAFAAGITRLEGISTKIDFLSIQQAKNITGVTGDKNTLLDDVSDYLVDVSGAIHSYAIAKGDKTLQARVNYKEAAISKMPQGEVLKAAAIVIEEADKIAPADLANEGITAAELTEFKDAYAQASGATTNTREAIIDRTGYTEQLADLFTEASDLKKNVLDRLASQFQRKDPEFYQKYKAAATVIYKRSAKAAVTEQTKTM